MRMLYEPVDQLGLEVTALLRELSRPSLPIVAPMGTRTRLVTSESRFDFWIFGLAQRGREAPILHPQSP